MMTKPDFEALFDASPYPYLLMAAPDLTIIGANRAYLRGTGRTAEDILGRCVFDAFPSNPSDPDSTNLQEVRTSIERAIATKLPDNTAFVRYAVPYESSEGTKFREIYWSTVHTPVLNAAGEVAFVAQNAIDVTELYNFDKTSQAPQLKGTLTGGRKAQDFNRAQMHEAMTRILNDERSHLRTLFNQAPGFIAVLKGKNHVFEIANEAYYQLVGHRDIIGKPVWKALPEVTGQGFEALLDAVWDTGEPFVGRGLKVKVQREPDGPMTENYIDLLYQPIFDANGAVTGIFAQGHDVTETHRAYEALAEKVEQLEKSRARQAFRLQLADQLRHLVSSSDIFTETSHLLGRHLAVSRVTCGEYDSQKKLVTFHSNYIAGDAVEMTGTYPTVLFSDANFALLEQGATWVCEDLTQDPRTCGPDTWPAYASFGIYAGVVVPLSRNGTLIASMFIHDSMPRRWTDEEIALIEDAAERASNAVERIRAEEALREADRRKDQFLAMLGHELRNPLAPISAAAELLQLAASNPERVKSTSRIIARQVSHMTGIVDDLLDVSRVTSGLVVLDKEDVDIKRVIADAVEQIRPLLESRGHRLLVETAPEPAYVSGDYKRLVQVLANVVNNAAKYTPDNGNLCVRMDTTANEVMLSVQDDGIGISPELLPNIFELFSQGERSADRSQGGLGLGLALVKSLVELHGGSVEALSDGLGRGSRFIVCLPRLDESSPRRLVDKASISELADGTSLRIMVVDDNVDAATMLAELLGATGHDVAVEHAPRAALERALGQKYDAYLLDIGLPEIDGTELARRLRAMPSGKNALMVAITGYGQQFDRRNALRAGFDYYFVKPVDPAKLVAILAGLKNPSDGFLAGYASPQ
jgi:PAS domain S-box-containing protein